MLKLYENSLNLRQTFSIIRPNRLFLTYLLICFCYQQYTKNYVNINFGAIFSSCTVIRCYKNARGSYILFQSATCIHVFGAAKYCCILCSVDCYGPFP
jgi:hypothetical protein